MAPMRTPNCHASGVQPRARPAALGTRPCVAARAAAGEADVSFGGTSIKKFERDMKAVPQLGLDESDVRAMYSEFEALLQNSAPPQIKAGDTASEVVRPGMVRDFQVLYQDKHEMIHLSLARRQKALLWQRLRQIQDEDVTVEGTVVSANRGGLVMEVFGQPAFCPGSHMGNVPDKESMMGKTMPVKLLDIDESSGKLTVSARRAAAPTTLKLFKIGDVVEGTVERVTAYGAFVQLTSGVSGLLHISQISHDRVVSIEKVLSVGDTLKVMIMSHDQDRGRLALSTKKIEPAPGDMLKDPALVYERAEEMAEHFKVRVAAAEAAARAEEERLDQARSLAAPSMTEELATY